MRQSYIYLILFSLLTISAFAQKVTLTPTAVNNTNVSGGPINLGGLPSSSVSLGVTVEMPVIPGNTGTINIFSSNGTNANVVIGGNGGALIFGEGKTASRSFVVNLSWSDFATSGSYIYAEYRTAGNLVYRSSNLAVIKNSTMTGGTNLNPPADAPNPLNITNTLCCNQTVRLGERPTPITGSQFLNPYDNLSYGIGSSWESKGNSTAGFLEVDNINKILTFDHITEPGNFTVTRTLTYLYKDGKVNKSNTVTITVVPSPIISNEIVAASKNLNSEGFLEHINVNPIEISSGLNQLKVDLDILDNPSHPFNRNDRFDNIERFEWEYSKTNKNLGGYNNWIIIPNENSAMLNYFNPNGLLDSEDNYYLLRRIAIYKNIKSSTKALKILVRTINYSNTLCCDQAVKILSSTSFDTPNTIIGSTPTINNTNITGTNFYIYDISYQWQVQSTGTLTPGTQDNLWVNISDATAKDYLPSQPFNIIQSGRRGETTFIFDKSYKYRRIARISYTNIDKSSSESVSSYSNEVSLYGSKLEEDLKLYPNPTITLLNVESKSISQVKIRIVNVTGTIVNSNDFSIINTDLISINVSNYIRGTYFISFEYPSGAIIQKIFIKQ